MVGMSTIRSLTDDISVALNTGKVMSFLLEDYVGLKLRTRSIKIHSTFGCVKKYGYPKS